MRHLILILALTVLTAPAALAQEAPLSDALLERAHKHFAVECFNECWTYIEMDGRSVEEDDMMLFLAMSSAYHWTQHPDVEPDNTAISAWQLSHVYALLGNGGESFLWADKMGEVVEHSDLDYWQQAFVAEAKARALHELEDYDARDEQIRRAITLGNKIEDPDDQAIVFDQLKTLKGYDYVVRQG